MFPFMPVLYNGCKKCHGLFSSLESFSLHALNCDGDKEQSPCDFFACPKDVYLKLISQIHNDTHKSNDTEISNDFTKRKKSFVSILQKNAATPSKSVGTFGAGKLKQIISDDKIDTNVETPKPVDKITVVVEERLPKNKTYGTRKSVEISMDTDDDTRHDGRNSTEAADDSNSEPLWIMSEKNGEVIYECKYCTHKSHHLGYMKMHCVIHNGGTEMKCEHCDFTTMWRSHMRNHRKQHAPPGYLCEVCSHTFKTRYSLKRHNARKHGGKANFACDMCDFISVNSSNLREHVRKHTGNALKCDQCSFTTNFERALSLHKARHQGVTRFVCDICGYKTIESSSFKRHILVHSGKKLFKCPDCAYTASSRYVVVKHIYGKHIDYKRYACKKCDFKTAYYSGLSMHLMSHEGVKPYQCSICSYRSNLSNKVKRHCAQKHLDEEVATVVKVDNCLKFDARDYANPDVPRVEVKVVRLGEDGTVNGELNADFDDCGEAEGTSVAMHSDLGEEGLLGDESPGHLPVLSQGGTEDLEDMSMIGEDGYGLCDDTTFPLGSQNYHSEDSNSFITRGRSDSTSSHQRLRYQAVDNLDIDMSELSHTPFKPFGSIGLRSESWDNLTLMKPSSFGNIGLGSRSESWDNLTQIKPALFKPFDPKDFLSSMKGSELEHKDHSDGASPVPSGSVFPGDGDQFPEISITDDRSTSRDAIRKMSNSSSNQEKDKSLFSLLSPEVTSSL